MNLMESPRPPAVGDPRLTELVESYRALLKSGHPFDRAAFRAEHADLGQALGECLDALDFLEAAGPALQAEAAGLPDGNNAIARALGDFQILREVGRGGMGVVYEAEQLSLGRRVALKVLPFAATMDPRHLQRFQNEARAAASLEHPHIVPVYGVGCERAVHFYAMKYIDGQSLAQVIADLRGREKGEQGKPSPSPSPHVEATVDATAGQAIEAPSAVTTKPIAGLSTIRSTKDTAYFRAVAQLGIQAAEALDYAHQLGIIHRDIKPANLMADAHGHLWVTDFGLAQIQNDPRLTMTGDLVGTLRYMSPEQALAERVVVDHRTDVYSLGVTLYELLTLEPAYRGKDRQELLRQISFEEPWLPRRVNKAIPAELEIIVLKAMERNPADRYATARELADDLGRFLEDKPLRARRPSLARRCRKWVRRHKSIATLTTALFIAALAVFGMLIWIAQDRATRGARIAGRADQALWTVEQFRREGRWLEAVEVALQTQLLLNSGPADAKLREEVAGLVNDLKLISELEEARLEMTAVNENGFDGDLMDRLYAEVFKRAGLDMDAVPVDQAVERIRRSSVAAELAMALDQWAVIRCTVKGGSDLHFKHLWRIVRAADPGGWRDMVRDALEQRNYQALMDLAGSEEALHQTPGTIFILANYLNGKSVQAEVVERLLRRARRRYPRDFWINHELAMTLERSRPPRWDEALGFYTAAVALRPQSPGAHLNLGHALYEKSRYDEAIDELQEALRLKPDYAVAHYSLGVALQGKGLLDESIACYREALRHKEDYVEARCNLGNVLQKKGLLNEAIECYHEALRLNKDHPKTHNNLGLALSDKGHLDEAITEFRAAIRLGLDDPLVHNNLGGALFRKGLVDAAIAEFREAIRLEKNDAMAHYNLGYVWQAKGLLDEAILEYREAVRIKKTHWKAYTNLGIALAEKGQHDEAIVCYKESLRINKEYQPEQRHNLIAVSLLAKGHLEKAIGEYREALNLKKSSTAQTSLARALQWKEAADKLPSFLKGEAQPADASDRIVLATLCQQPFQRLYTASARFYSEAFSDQPKLAEDLNNHHRYNAACAAALAGCGQGKDADKLDAKEMARLRQQALNWLKNDLKSYRQLIEKSSNKTDPELARHMEHWRQDKDFAGVRGPEALAKLPEPERNDWKKLWQEVEALRRRITSGK